MKTGILWIDDDPDRKTMSKHVERLTKVAVDFVSVEGVDLGLELANILKKDEPSCVLIDHVLNKVRKEGLQIERGSTVAGLMREKWNNCPIVGLTAAPNLKDVDIEKLAYDELVNYDEFGDYAKYLPYLIVGFQKLAAVRDYDGLFALLAGPECEKGAIYSCMPEELKAEDLKKNFASRAYHWIRMRFYLRPGFLYDADWLATLIGVKKEVFGKYAKHFAEARYSGIFCDPANERWWKANSYKLIQASGMENPSERLLQEVANEWLKVEDEDRSKCYRCHERWPEVMAYTDQNEHAGYEQMHLECTTDHPRFPFRPAYEEVRVMME